MSSGSSNNLNGDVEPNKTKHDANNEESSHLLEASENGAKYGSRQAVKIVKANASESANASPQLRKYDCAMFDLDSADKEKKKSQKTFKLPWAPN